jgi:hypothetical protein
VASLFHFHVAISADLKLELNQRAQKEVSVEQSYSDSDLLARTLEAKRIFRAAEQRILKNSHLLQQHRSGLVWATEQERLVAEALEAISQTGDVPVRMDRSNNRTVVSRYAKALGGADSEHTWKRLFLDACEAASLAYLIAVSSGWNVTTISELGVPERVSTASDAIIHRVTLVKRRRSSSNVYETRNIEDVETKSLGRLLSRAVAITGPTREYLDSLGFPTERLIVWRVNRVLPATEPDSIFNLGLTKTAQMAFVGATGLSLNFRRIRKAVNTRYRREPNQNTRATHDRVYVMPDRDAQKLSAGVIAAGVNAAVSSAAQTVLAQISVIDDDLRERDTVTSACSDNTHSPFGVLGFSCRASFLMCLACPNAIIMPRHRGRIAYLHAAISELRGTLGAEAWRSQWEQHFNRLEHVRTAYCTDGEWQQALTQVGDIDKAVVDHLLRGRLD